MERLIKESEKVSHSLEIAIDYDYGDKPFDVKLLQKYLARAVEDGATHVKIVGTCYDDTVESIEIQPEKVVFESDEDFAKRLTEEGSRQKAAENVRIAKEKALYEELKAKYGDNNE
jgi:anion-transporting  ArsA/GET3 family ATPase